MTDLVPDGYDRVAETPFRYATATVYRNKREDLYYLVVDESLVLGPITLNQLEALQHVSKDALEMRGR